MAKRFLTGCVAAIALVMAMPSMAMTVQDDDYVDIPGMGVSPAPPEGTPFVLPEGLTIEEPIRGYNTYDPEDCDFKYADQAVGKGEQVRLCVVFNNATNSPITLQLPPGLAFVSRNLEKQNGIIAQRISIEVPARTRYFQPLFTYCVNSGRDSASFGDEYDVGNVTNLPAFQALFQLIEDKVITDTNFVVVMSAMKTISNGEALDADQLAQLEAL